MEGRFSCRWGLRVERQPLACSVTRDKHMWMNFAVWPNPQGCSPCILLQALFPPPIPPPLAFLDDQEKWLGAAHIEGEFGEYLQDMRIAEVLMEELGKGKCLACS